MWWRHWRGAKVFFLFLGLLLLLLLVLLVLLWLLAWAFFQLVFLLLLPKLT